MTRDHQGEAFVVELAGQLHRLGSSSPRIEAAVTGVSRALGLDTQILASPTALQLAFGTGAAQRCLLIRSNSGPIDLGRLVELDLVIDAVMSGAMDAGTGLCRLQQLSSTMPSTPPLWTIAGFALASAAGACLLGGGIPDLVASGVLAAAIGVLAHWSGADRRRAALLELVAAAVASYGAAVVTNLLIPLREGVVTMAALIVLIPGLSFTAAMSELADGHLNSGTSRLAASMISFLQLGLGIALGRLAADTCFGLDRMAEVPSAVLPGWATYVALPIAASAFVVLFHARWRYLPIIGFVGFAGFVVTSLVGKFVDSTLGAFAGAFCAGAMSNYYARLRKRPASLPLLPGIILLVPGTVGMRSLGAFLQSDLAGGAGAAFGMTLSGIALVGGMLLAHLLVAPRRFL